MNAQVNQARTIAVNEIPRRSLSIREQIEAPSPKLQQGQRWIKPWPFLLEKEELFEWFGGDDFGDCVAKEYWRPGWKSEFCHPDDTIAVCDAVGRSVRNIIAIVPLPEPYKTRVFYKQSWISPTSKEFGKKALKNTSKAAFSSWVRGTNHSIVNACAELDKERV